MEMTENHNINWGQLLDRESRIRQSSTCYTRSKMNMVAGL